MKNTVKRDANFGQLVSATNDTHLKAARRLLELAIKAALLDAPYVDVDRKHRGAALNYDLYDAKDGVALFQRRYTVCTKYGNSPSKDYCLLRRKGRGVELEWLGGSEKARVVKLSRVATTLGEVINTLTGVAKRPLKAKVARQVRMAYKIVESRDGTYYSVYEPDLEWALGKTRIEASTPNHTGGYYVFADRATALHVLARNEVFSDAWQRGKRLALLECEVAGKVHEHDNGKLCVSRVKPVQLVQHLN